MLEKLEATIWNICRGVGVVAVCVSEARQNTFSVKKSIESYTFARDYSNDDDIPLCSSPGRGHAGRVCPRCGILSPCNASDGAI